MNLPHQGFAAEESPIANALSSCHGRAEQLVPQGGCLVAPVAAPSLTTILPHLDVCRRHCTLFERVAPGSPANHDHIRSVQVVVGPLLQRW
jgi:hypothetical protein